MIFNVRITLKNKNNEIRVFYKEIGAANLSSYDGTKSHLILMGFAFLDGTRYFGAGLAPDALHRFANASGTIITT